MSLGTPPETQPERTRLSWRRTLNGVLAVGGIGALRTITEGEVLQAAMTAVLAIIAMWPMYWRQIVLRHSNAPATWEPFAVSAAICALGASVILTP